MQIQSADPEILLPHIYAAATDNDAWAEFCEALNHLLDVPVTLFSHNMMDNQCLGMLGAGWDPELIVQYEQYYGIINPWAAMNNSLPVGFTGVSDYALPREQLFKTEFYNDWLLPQENMVVGSAQVCYRDADRFLALGATCPARRHEVTLPAIVHAFQILGPHVRRAIELSAVFLNDNGDGCDSTGLSRHAIISIRQNGSVAGMNPAAENLLRQCNELSIGFDGKLFARCEDVAARITKAICDMQSKKFNTMVEPILLKTGKTGAMLMHAHIFPERDEIPYPSSVWCDPGAGCFVISSQQGLGEIDVRQILGVAFGATKAEARLGQALMDGVSIGEHAFSRKLSKNTVRNQMSALLTKTGCRSQADIVRKISGMISPFGP